MPDERFNVLAVGALRVLALVACNPALEDLCDGGIELLDAAARGRRLATGEDRRQALAVTEGNFGAHCRSC